MKIENLFYFTKYPRRILINSILCCYIQSNIRIKHDLFHSLSEQLKFSVFGWNWNALHDSLSDFEGVNEKNIIIMHEKLKLQEDILYEYILCIISATLIWKKHSYDHRLFPVFSVLDKASILEMLYSEEMQKRFIFECERFNFVV